MFSQTRALSQPRNFEKRSFLANPAVSRLECKITGLYQKYAPSPFDSSKMKPSQITVNGRFGGATVSSVGDSVVRVQNSSMMRIKAPRVAAITKLG